MKSLGIFIATPGRRSLWKTLASISYQQAPIEDVLVVGDGYNEDADEMCSLAAALLKLPVRYVATKKTRDFGHTQQNYALKHVKGDYLIYQDDDDIFLPRALNEASNIVSGFQEAQPLVGRVKTPFFGLLWQSPGPDKAVLDGHCVVVPNDKRKLGWFTSSYNGDQAYIHTTLRNYPTCAWVDRVWTLTRPTWSLHPRQQSSLEDTVFFFTLSRGDIVGETPLVEITMEKVPDVDTYQVALHWRTSPTIQEQQEVAEFIVYAGQGSDVSFFVNDSIPAFPDVLDSLKYKKHMTTPNATEFFHEWPPNFWQEMGPFTHIIGEDQLPIPDWRDDVWGWRPRYEPLPETE